MNNLPESSAIPCFRLIAIWLAFAVSLAGVQTLVAQTGSPVAELTWKNGDKVPGHIVSADSSRLKWQAGNLFRDPLNLDLMFLDQIELKQTAAPAKTTETYSIQMVDGFSLFGQITRLNDKHLFVSSPRFGDIQVNRERIAAILNLKNSGSLINGEFDLNLWGSDRGEKKYWSVNDQGQLQSQRNNIHLYFKSELPDSALVEVEFQWQKKLDFTFGFGVPRNTRSVESLPRLESWDDSIVLSHGDDFDIVVESNDQESKRLKLLIHWNQKTGAIVIHDEQGKQLAVAELGQPSRSIEPGIFIENKSGDLTVATLMIRKSSTGFDATRPSLQSTDEAAINGVIQSFDGSAWTVGTGDEGNSELAISAEQFCGAFLVNPSEARPRGLTRVKFLDGMFLAGDFVSIENGKLTLQPTFTSQPVGFELGGVSSLRFDTPLPEAAAESFSHKLFNDAGEIQGRLEEGSGAADDILRWRVAGAESAVPFSQGNARIVLKQNQPVVDATDHWSDTLYLTNRDTIPCRVVGIDETHVTVDSISENKRIDQELVKAVDLRSDPVALSADAGADQWVFLEPNKKLVTVTDEKMSIAAGARFGHPSLLSSGSFEFDLSWNSGYGVLECQLMATDAEANEGGKKVNITFYGDNLYLGDAGEGNVNGRLKEIKTNSKARIRFSLEKGEIVASVNGRKTYTGSISGEGFLGRGVNFHLNDMYGQGIRCTMSGVERTASSLGSGFFVDANRMNLLLTIPRLKKNLPPKQILCASNTDMLRGELISMDATKVVFRANNEDKQFPRQIVNSVVWLHAENLAMQETGDDATGESTVAKDVSPKVKPAEVAAPASPNATQTVQVLMQGGRRMTSTLRSWKDGKLSGDSPALGTCHIPFEQISELRFGSYATEATDVAYADWVAHLAPAPKMETGADGNAGSEMLFGSSSPLIGTTPKTFTAKMLDGSTFNLKDQQGKVVVLDFWATWCGPCVQALPGMTRVISNYTPDQVAFVAVNQEETIDKISEFLKSRKLEFPVALDDGKLGRQFSVEAIPQTVIIDRNGKIAFVNVGISAKLDEKLAAAIEHLLDHVVTETAEEK